MKFGDKIYTYKDIEEAKKLIGKKVAFSDNLQDISTTPSACLVEVLDDINKFNEFLYFDNTCARVVAQFIREVIEDEPTYRPFNSVDELIKYWDKNYCTTPRPKGTMPWIWVRHKNNSLCFLITRYETTKNSVCVSESTQWFNLENLFEFYEFLDGSPCGVKE